MPTTPPTFVAGDILEADQLNQLGDGIVELQAVAEGVTFQGAEVKRTGTQSIADGSDVTVVWQSEAGGIGDIGGWWSSGTDIIVPAGAIPSGATEIAVHVEAGTNFAANGTGTRFIRILQDGSIMKSYSTGAISGDPTEVSVGKTLKCVAGTVITIVVHQTSGGALNISASNTYASVERRGTIS